MEKQRRAMHREIQQWRNQALQNKKHKTQHSHEFVSKSRKLMRAEKWVQLMIARTKNKGLTYSRAGMTKIVSGSMASSSCLRAAPWCPWWPSASDISLWSRSRRRTSRWWSNWWASTNTAEVWGGLCRSILAEQIPATISSSTRGSRLSWKDDSTRWWSLQRLQQQKLGAH